MYNFLSKHDSVVWFHPFVWFHIVSGSCSRQCYSSLWNEPGFNTWLTICPCDPKWKITIDKNAYHLEPLGNYIEETSLVHSNFLVEANANNRIQIWMFSGESKNSCAKCRKTNRCTIDALTLIGAKVGCKCDVRNEYYKKYSGASFVVWTSVPKLKRK